MHHLEGTERGAMRASGRMFQAEVPKQEHPGAFLEKPEAGANKRTGSEREGVSQQLLRGLPGKGFGLAPEMLRPWKWTRCDLDVKGWLWLLCGE